MTELRHAAMEDVGAMADLLALLFEQEAEFAPDRNRQWATLTAIVSDPDLGVALVAERDGCCIGVVLLLYTVSTALGGRVGLLEDLVVAPAARGAGVGTALLEGVLATAAREGCRRVTLLTDADNHAAHRLYLRHGFSASAMRPYRWMPPAG